MHLMQYFPINCIEETLHKEGCCKKKFLVWAISQKSDQINKNRLNEKAGSAENLSESFHTMKTSNQNSVPNYRLIGTSMYIQYWLK